MIVAICGENLMLCNKGGKKKNLICSMNQTHDLPLINIIKCVQLANTVLGGVTVELQQVHCKLMLFRAVIKIFRSWSLGESSRSKIEQIFL